MRRASRRLHSFLGRRKHKLGAGVEEAIIQLQFWFLRGRCRLTVLGQHLALQAPSVRQYEISIRRLSNPTLSAQRQHFSLLGVMSPDIIVDVGANTGYTSIAYALLFPSSLILALEPSSRNFEDLLSNCVTFPNIRPLNVGAHDQDTSVVLQMPSKSQNPKVKVKTHFKNTGLLSMYGASGRWVESAMMRPLDLIVRDEMLLKRRIGFLKIDVEGNELCVLKGATQILAEHRPVMEIEVNRRALGMAEVPPASIGLAREYGCEAYLYDNLSLVPVGEDVPRGYDVTNVVFIPQ